MAAVFPVDQALESLKRRFDNIRKTLQKKFQNPAIHIELQHVQLSNDVYKYFDANTKKPHLQDSHEKIELLLKIKQNLRQFLNGFIKPKLQNLNKEHHQMVELLTQLWSHYQKLIYCYNYIVNSSLRQFCSNFYKAAQKFKEKLQGQSIGTVAVMGAICLKLFIENDFKALVKNFSDTFCWFILEERQGKAIPKDMIKDSLAFFQSCYLNHEASIEREGDKIFLAKKPNKQLRQDLKSKDDKFFQQNFLPSLTQSVSFYNKFVKQQAPKLTATDEILKMRNILKEQSVRADQYINSNNRAEYLREINNVVILQSIGNRITRIDGLRKYLSGYNQDNAGNQAVKVQYQEQLKNFWEVYSKVLSNADCIGAIKNIYADYLLEEGKVVKSKINKSKEFIEELIRISKKNNSILEIFSKNFELKNMLKNTMAKMMSDNLIVDNQTKAVNIRGAKNLALYVDFKFKVIYSKPNEKKLLSDTITDVVSIFKVLIEKDAFFKDHERFTAIRLIDEVDFSKQDEFLHIINLQSLMINNIGNEIGLAEVKSLAEILKDMSKSNQDTKRIKDQVNNKHLQFNQLVIKSSSYWTQSTLYQIQNPPNLLIKQMEAVRTAMSQRGEIKFELNQGVSMLKGSYLNRTDQIFQFRNIYAIILLLIDQEKGKKMKFGDLKMKIRPISTSGKKFKSNDLQINMIELLHIGLVRSNKVLKESESVGKVLQSDEFELNLNFNYEEEQKRQKRPANTIKKFKKINTQQLTTLPPWLDKAIKLQLKQLKQEEDEYNIMKKFQIKKQMVKMLKHAHHDHGKLCVFDDFVKGLQKEPRMKEYPATHREVKDFLQELIGEGICQRLEDRKDAFKYIA